jgi:hypothetical protein
MRGPDPAGGGAARGRGRARKEDASAATTTAAAAAGLAMPEGRRFQGDAPIMQRPSPSAAGRARVSAGGKVGATVRDDVRREEVETNLAWLREGEDTGGLGPGMTGRWNLLAFRRYR